MGSSIKTGVETGLKDDYAPQGVLESDSSRRGEGIGYYRDRCGHDRTCDPGSDRFNTANIESELL